MNIFLLPQQSESDTSCEGDERCEEAIHVRPAEKEGEIHQPQILNSSNTRLHVKLATMEPVNQ